MLWAKVDGKGLEERVAKMENKRILVKLEESPIEKKNNLGDPMKKMTKLRVRSHRLRCEKGTCK